MAALNKVLDHSVDNRRIDNFIISVKDGEEKLQQLNLLFLNGKSECFLSCLRAVAVEVASKLIIEAELTAEETLG